MKKWLVAILIGLFIVVLYAIEFSKINKDDNKQLPTLDEIKVDDVAREWEPFYHVRATIIDGQSANFSIPDELQGKVGKQLELSGAPVFFGSGCAPKGNKVAVTTFFLLPSLGLAEACEILPDVAMRWTIHVKLSEDWILDRNDMISAMAKVSGQFRIDTSKPYESAFFLDNAKAELIPEEER